VPADVIQIFTDACPYGYGWAWAQERQAFTWTAKERRRHINILEAQTVLRLLEADLPSFARCRILLWCDNSVTVNAIRKGSRSSPIMRDIVRSIRAICMQHHILLWPLHISGKLNVTADGLSRGFVSARSDRWSLNTAIMNRWRATVGGKFNVDAFPDPSGRGAPATRFHSTIDPPFGRNQLERFRFPPLGTRRFVFVRRSQLASSFCHCSVAVESNSRLQRQRHPFACLWLSLRHFFSAEAAKK